MKNKLPVPAYFFNAIREIKVPIFRLTAIDYDTIKDFLRNGTLKTSITEKLAKLDRRGVDISKQFVHVSKAQLLASVL